jgi:hypothetical protein
MGSGQQGFASIDHLLRSHFSMYREQKKCLTQNTRKVFIGLFND